MNNIYKVIWSKAKNCYVVASEIARSHTKSATGSEKIGGVTKRSLLASLMALSLLCGGLGVASAADGTVHVQDIAATATTKEVYTTEKVYTKTETDGQLALKANATDVAKNTENIATNKENIHTLDGKLANLTTAVNGKADAANVYTKNDADAKLALKADETALNDKADKADVYSKTDADARYATKNALDGKADITYVDQKFTDAGNNVDTKLGDYYRKAEVDSKIADEVNARDTKITAAIDQERDDRDAAIGNAINGEVTARNQAINTAITQEVTARDLAVANAKTELQNKITEEKTARADKDAELEGRITQNSQAIETLDKSSVKYDNPAVKDKITLKGAGGTTISNLKDAALNDLSNDAVTGKQLYQTNENLAAETTARTDKDTELEKGIAKNSGDITALDGKIKTNADNIQTNADNIKNNKDEIARVNGELVKTNDYFNKELGKTNNHFNTELGKTNAALQATNKRTAGIGRTNTGVEAGNQTVIEGKVYFDQNGNVSGVKDLQTDTIHATGEITSGGLDAKAGDIKTTGKVSAGDVSTGTLETTGNAKIGGDLTVNGKLNVGEIYMEHKKQESTGEEYDSATSITADGISNNAKVTDRNGVTTESKFTHDKEGSTTYAYQGDAANWKKSTSNVTADGVENVAEDSKGNNNTFTQTSTDTKNILKDKDGNTSTTRQDSKGIYGYAKDKDGNKSYTKQEGNRIAESVIGQDGKQTKSKMTSTDITNTAKDGTIKNDAKDIVNNATGNMTNTVGGYLTTTVGGNELHEVTGKQTNTVGGGQENIISGGQINNITGDQTTTITGKKTETVTENVTEDYKKDLTTTVGGNENHEVKGTKTETVEGKVIENFKNGQETNVTEDQVIKVSGTQTTTATDIKRNASSGMIDTIDNDYGTNTETKVAGKTTTDVSIKGTEEKGQYIRGANESRDYLIKGTLKNSETKTVDATSTEITDGTNKASTIQKVTDVAGSVTNGTETGVSGIHAKDNSVSIDSIVTDGNKYSVINQKKGSIQSTVVDGTSSTVILQDKDNVTIASSNGMVGIVGKDIVNNAQDTITNTAGTKITDKVGTNTRVIDSTSITDTVGTANRKIEDGKIIDTAGDFTVTTENGNGTTFAKKTGSTAYSTEVGAPTDTNIAGNHITTGRVDANELGVSDKDDQGNTADLSVKAGEGIKSSATDKDGNTTYTKVTATENSFQVQDKDGKNKNHQVNTKGSSVTEITDKDGNTTKTEQTATDITNEASNSITDKVGTNTRVLNKDGITDTVGGSTFKQRIDAIMMESKDVSIKAEETLTNEASEIKNQADKLISNKVGENTLEKLEDGKITTSITKGTKANTVISTVDGTSFINSEAAAPVTGASGAGTAVNTTIKGNTITTGKVTMDYAEVMKDLGVTGKTTTGSLEVKGESKLTGKVTMESDATVGGTLDVTKKATFRDDVDIKKNLSVVGDVTANSYKVGDKTYISAAGINANDQKITNVADGSISEGSKDAVNGGQLYGVKRDLEHQVDKVGANAAAMANLRPMEFDPSSKWNIAAAIGNYGSETAAALGAFYRPNDNVMVNLSTAFGTGENMVGGGVSVRLGKGGNKLSREETNALKAQVADLTARMDALLSVLNPNMSKDFPDVPENHWAYEAVSRLAGNDIVQGYPDGEFHGERTMTRYEMAEIIYNALSRGAEAERELVEEFKPELQAMAASEKATAEKAEG